MNYSALQYFSSTFGYGSFGSVLVGRSWIAGSEYRYGFNGYENLNEMLADNIAIDFGARIYNSQLGRFLSMDPLTDIYTWQTPYAYFANSPISIVDKKGLGGGDECESEIEPEKYTIKEDDSYWKIAQASNGEFTQQNLKDWNPDVNWMQLQIGSQINISDPAKADLVNAVEMSTIPFYNNNYEVRPTDLALFTMNYMTTPSLYAEFEIGYGPENSVFTEDHYASQELQYFNKEVERMRDYTYEKFGYNYETMKEYAKSNGQLLVSGWSGYGGQFKPTMERGGPSQFIGSFSGDILLSYDGTSLVFVITDSKSVSSLFYHITDLFNNDRIGASDSFGNTYQKYIWNEPVTLEK